MANLLVAAVGNRVERYREIASVLSRHSLSFLVRAAGLERWLPHTRGQANGEPDAAGGEAGGQADGPAHGQAHSRRSHRKNAENLRRALEELGPTFIKLGQMLSTRSDLLPPEYLEELSKLQDAAPAVAAADIRRVIIAELGDDPAKVFSTFQYTPLASASIGQAHTATLHDGTEVVVKVQRPDISTKIAIDLEILHTIAVRAGRQWKLVADYNVPGIVDGFSRSLRSELDYLHEGRNAETFGKNFDGNATIRIPRVFWDTSTTRVLTLERLAGIKVDDLVALDAVGIDRETVIANAVGAVAQMVFVDGFFHADPHPGNLFVEPDARIGLIDFGMVGIIDDGLRERLADLFVALSRDDPDRMASALIALSTSKRSLDEDRLRVELGDFVALYRGKGLGEVNMAAVVNALFGVLRRNRLQLQPEVIMLLRMLLMIEGIGAALDPGFNLGEAVKPYATKLALERFSPLAIAKRLSKASLEAAELGIELPAKIRRAFDLIDRNGVEVHLRAAELDPLVSRVERMGTRVVAGVIVAAFIRSVGQLVASDRSRWGAWSGPLMGVGVGASGALSAYLAWTSRKKRRSGR